LQRLENGRIYGQIVDSKSKWTISYFQKIDGNIRLYN